MTQPHPIGVGEIADFILKERDKEHNKNKAKVFLDWTIEELRIQIVHHYIQKTLAIAQDAKTLEITGVVMGDKDDDKKIFYVRNILTIKDKGKSLKELLKLFKAKYPGYTLLGKRHGEIKQYDTPRLFSKLSV